MLLVHVHAPEFEYSDDASIQAEALLAKEDGAGRVALDQSRNGQKEGGQRKQYQCGEGTVEHSFEQSANAECGRSIQRYRRHTHEVADVVIQQFEIHQARNPLDVNEVIAKGIGNALHLASSADWQCDPDFVDLILTSERRYLVKMTQAMNVIRCGEIGICVDGCHAKAAPTVCSRAAVHFLASIAKADNQHMFAVAACAARDREQ